MHEVAALKAIPEATMAVIDKICGRGSNPFAPGGIEGQRSTDFACGKWWVAGTLRGFREVKMPIDPRGPPPGVVEPPAKAPEPQPKV